MGVDDFAESSKVKKFNVIPQQANNHTHYTIERSVEFLGETADYIAVYSRLTKVLPVDLSAYKTLEFKAKGTGVLSVQLVKPDIPDWQERHKINIKLTNRLQSYKIPLSEFKDYTNTKIDHSAVSSMLFVMKSNNGQVTQKALSLHDLKFTKEINDLLSVDSDEIIVSTLSDDFNMKIHFNSSSLEPHTLVVYDSNGRVVLERIVNPNLGLNTITVSTQKLHRGLYIVHISSATKQFNPEKCLIP